MSPLSTEGIDDDWDLKDGITIALNNKSVDDDDDNEDDRGTQTWFDQVNQNKGHSSLEEQVRSLTNRISEKFVANPSEDEVQTQLKQSGI